MTRPIDSVELAQDANEMSLELYTLAGVVKTLPDDELAHEGFSYILTNLSHRLGVLSQSLETLEPPFNRLECEHQAAFVAQNGTACDHRYFCGDCQPSTN